MKIALLILGLSLLASANAADLIGTGDAMLSGENQASQDVCGTGMQRTRPASGQNLRPAAAAICGPGAAAPKCPMAGGRRSCVWSDACLLALQVPTPVVTDMVGMWSANATTKNIKWRLEVRGRGRTARHAPSRPHIPHDAFLRGRITGACAWETLMAQQSSSSTLSCPPLLADL